MFELKIFHDRKLLKHIREMFLIREALSDSELNLPWSSVWVVIQYNKFILGVVYNGIIVYLAVRVAKGLDSGKSIVIRGTF